MLYKPLVSDKFVYYPPVTLQYWSKLNRWDSAKYPQLSTQQLFIFISFLLSVNVATACYIPDI